MSVRTRWRSRGALPTAACLAALCLAACDRGATSPPPAASPPGTVAGAGAAPADVAAPAPGAAPAAAPAATTPAAAPAPTADPDEDEAPDDGSGPLVEERSGTTLGGKFLVSWKPVPDPVPFNESFQLIVTVARAATPQTPDAAARLELDATMPSHGHGMNRTPRVTANGDGTFRVEGMLLHMSGRWDLIFHVYSGSEYGQAILRLDLP